MRASDSQVSEIKSQNEKSAKILSEAAKSSQRDKFGSYTGRSNLDNTPVFSTDLGLVMTIGGGM